MVLHRPFDPAGILGQVGFSLDGSMDWETSNGKSDLESDLSILLKPLVIPVFHGNQWLAGATAILPRKTVTEAGGREYIDFAVA